jgi:hypothetical protein
VSIKLIQAKPLVLIADERDLRGLDSIDAGTAFTKYLHAQTGEFPQQRLGDHMYVVSSGVNPRSARGRDTMFEYVDLREIDDVFGQVLDFRRTLGANIGSTKHRFQRNDILFAKIMPSLENKKLALVTQDVANGVASTEFVVLRRRTESPLDVYFLFRSLRSDFFTRQAVANTTGATGRQRINPQRLLELKIIVPPVEICRQVSTAVEEEFRLRAIAAEQCRAANDLAEPAIGSTTVRTMKVGLRVARRRAAASSVTADKPKVDKPKANKPKAAKPKAKPRANKPEAATKPKRAKRK